jgi:hypothetical protein
MRADRRAAGRFRSRTRRTCACRSGSTCCTFRSRSSARRRRSAGTQFRACPPHAPFHPTQLTTARRAVAFTSFLFLGFLEIGQEIENPFEYAENDLDLDGICMGIQRELAEVTAHTCPEPDAYVFTAWNQPFAPADRRTAQEIVEDASHDYHHRAAGLAHMRRTLLKSWRHVDNQTRLHYEVDAPITPA